MYLDVDGARLAPIGTRLGVRDFELPPSAADVTLHAVFAPELPGSNGASAHKATVVTIQQPYSVIDGGTALQTLPMAGHVAPHPLVDTVMAANLNGVVEARLDTTLVDVSEFWQIYAEGWADYVAERDLATPGMKIDFASARGRNLHALSASAIRLLWANGDVAAGLPFVRLGRFGLSGYSGAGYQLFSALRGNMDRIDELYAATLRRPARDAVTGCQDLPPGLSRAVGLLTCVICRASRFSSWQPRRDAPLLPRLDQRLWAQPTPAD